MAVKSKSALKSYFEAGDEPNQSQFEDLVDTIVAIAEGGGSFGAGSIPLIVSSGTDFGKCGHDYVGIITAGGAFGNKECGATKNGLQFNNVTDYYKVASFSIGSWDMNTDSFKAVDVSSYIGTRAMVLGVMVKIISDVGHIYGFIGDGGSWNMLADGVIRLEVESGSIYDTDANFSNTGPSRGEITVIYDETNT